MTTHKYDYSLTILLFGGKDVGKIPFLLRYTDYSFNPNHITNIDESKFLIYYNYYK